MALTKATALAVANKAAALHDAETKLPHAGFDIQEVLTANTDDVEALRDTDRLKAEVSAYLKARDEFEAAVAEAS